MRTIVAYLREDKRVGAPFSAATGLGGSEEVLYWTAVAHMVLNKAHVSYGE
jgi:hypothetical protein